MGCGVGDPPNAKKKKKKKKILFNLKVLSSKMDKDAIRLIQ